ncbi:MAG: phosphoribosylglycinamide formyltransferase [Panacagrimonas sp.]
MPEPPRPATATAARIAVVISGQGRNLQALAIACADGRIDGQIVTVISNVAAAPGLAYARGAGLATQVIPHGAFATRDAFDRALAEALDAQAPDFVLLAGFMRVLTPVFVRRYHGCLLNVHPSLLPRHPGLHTHRRAIAAGDAEHGASVHFVTEALDGGPVIVQGGVRVQPEDTPDSLADRVMQDVELKIYPQAVAWMARGELCLDGNAVQFRNRLLRAPLGLADVEEVFR